MPWSDVFANVWLPLRLAGISKDKARPRIEEALAQVGLGGFAKAYPRQLSGGMKMRVSIARALVTRPQVLLMDEPFAALDEITRLKLNDDLAELQASLNATVVFVTHSVFESVYLADRIVVMAARPGAGVRGDFGRGAADPARALPPDGDLCGSLQAHLHCAARGHGRGAAERVGAMTRDDLVGYAVPAFTLGCGLLAWEGLVRYFAIPPYLLPAPSVIIATLFTDWGTLSSSLWVTLSITLKALLAAVVGSVALAVIFAQSRLVERAFYPFAVAMQVTPIVAIAPLLLIYLTPSVAVLVCAFLVAFFPLLANTTLGLSSADHNLVELFAMYRATRLQQFMLLRLPSALPYFLAGLRISGGLALIGAIVAEIAAGSAGQGSGLAYRIVESGFRLNIPRMFAALLLISVAGITIHVLLTALSHWLLSDWHESERGREA